MAAPSQPIIPRCKGEWKGTFGEKRKAGENLATKRFSLFEIARRQKVPESRGRGGGGTNGNLDQNRNSENSVVFTRQDKMRKLG